MIIKLSFLIIVQSEQNIVAIDMSLTNRRTMFHRRVATLDSNRFTITHRKGAERDVQAQAYQTHTVPGDGDAEATVSRCSPPNGGKPQPTGVIRGCRTHPR